MCDESKPGEKSPVLPFIVIGLICCITSYPLFVAIQLWPSDERPQWPELLYLPAVVLACCWVLYSVTLWIVFRLWWLRDKSKNR